MTAATEPMRQRILEERDGAVLIVTIDCPSRKNAIAPVLRTAMEEVMERAHGDDTIRAIVVTGDVRYGPAAFPARACRHWPRAAHPVFP
jgi:1,4-dihydroxy-2-naphthoyl-CoA synthase